MRKILFRGKRLDNGEWVMSGNLIHADDNDIHSFYIPEPKSEFGTIEDEHDNILSIEYGTFYKVDPATVGQCTGLKDMNGKWIFEGDIVQIGEENGKIEYSETEAMFQVVFDTWCTDFDHYFGTDFEVIGNIHDNPELLEEA